jgi:hypothetical protein
MSTSAPPTAADRDATARVDHRISGAELAPWIDALTSVVLIPPGFREKTLTREQALTWLGCRPGVFDAIVSAGLPEVDPDPQTGESRYDFHDLTNIGLHARTGRSTAELGERAVLRFAASEPTTWVSPREWAVELNYRCGYETDCRHGAWRFAESAVSAFGGRLDAFGIDQAGADVTIRIEATLVGTVRPVLAGPIAQAYEHVLAALLTPGLRYQWLPDRLRRDPAAALALGVADCLVTSVELTRMLERAGVEARTRTVTSLGVAGIDHAWTEARDSDGQWKILDPVFAHLAMRRPGTRPEFEEFCRGSNNNRSLAWEASAMVGVAAHHCAGSPVPIQSSIRAGATRHV